MRQYTQEGTTYTTTYTGNHRTKEASYENFTDHWKHHYRTGTSVLFTAGSHHSTLGMGILQCRIRRSQAVAEPAAML